MAAIEAEAKKSRRMMKCCKPFHWQIELWLDLVVIGLMSLASPWIAAYLHSAWVYHRGFAFYNAEVGGKYFLNQGYGYGSLYPNSGDLIAWVGGCGVPGILTFLGLLWLRRRPLTCWLVWCLFIVLWTCLLFKIEVRIK